MTATRLKLYNGALRILGAREIASLSESRESRRVLDGIWNDGLLDYCLEQGFWKWAIRTQEIAYDPDIDPDFGFSYAFGKPTDYVRTYALCSDENFNSPITRYDDETTYIYTDIDTIYLKFVSDDEDYGLNYAAWPETFVSYVESEFASRACLRLTQSQSKKDQIVKDTKKLLVDARSKDAMGLGVKYLHRGTWSSARGGSGSFNAVLPST